MRSRGRSCTGSDPCRKRRRERSSNFNLPLTPCDLPVSGEDAWNLRLYRFCELTSIASCKDGGDAFNENIRFSF